MDELLKIINEGLLNPNRSEPIKIELNPNNPKEGRVTWNVSYPTRDLSYNTPVLNTVEVNASDYYPLTQIQNYVLNYKEDIKKKKQVAEEFRQWRLVENLHIINSHIK